MNKENFKRWPHFDAAEISAVADVLRSGKINRWTGGENIKFEEAICNFTGAKRAIAVSNGTLALELALRGVSLEKGSEVVTSCRTFVASASSVVAQGGVPVVADVDLDSQCITAQTVEKCLTKKTRGIIVVHHAGWPADMDGIMALAKDRGLFVIEDCAQAHGAAYKGKSVGSIGDVGAWSFCQDKIITTGGEGGAVTTSSDEAYFKMWSYKDHGRDYDAVYNRKHPEGFRWLIESFGSNFRMTEMQAVLGISGVRKLAEWVKRRRENAAAYIEALKDIPCVRVPLPKEGEFCSYYKFYFFLRPEAMKSGISREEVIAKINSLGIPAFSGTCWNISAEKCFVDRGWGKSAEDLPNAAVLRDTSVMLLTHPTIEPEDSRWAAEEIAKILRGVCR